MIKMTNSEYARLVKEMSPNSPLAKNMLKAFIAGGIICTIGQIIYNGWSSAGLNEKFASGATSVSMVFLGALLTGLGIYDTLAKFGGAGTLVPITGFAHSVVSPALEFKSEGLIAGMSAKMFVIAGPVIVFGLAASVLYGLILIIFT